MEEQIKHIASRFKSNIYQFLVAAGDMDHSR